MLWFVQRMAHGKNGDLSRRCRRCGQTDRVPSDGRCRACYRRYRRANSSQVNAWNRASNERRGRRVPTPEERELANSAQRAAYAADGERRRAQSREWLRAHPEYNRLNFQRYRARLKGVAATLTEAEWRGILTFFGHACAYCLRTDRPLTQDHVIPVSRGGEHTAENVVPACLSCNAKKGNRPIFRMLRHT
jgi:5-methylcytosine-specific restriction endonuclease McrA